MPRLYIIGGANGSGKTTTAIKLLPEFLECNEYVNADAIANGISAFNTGSVAIEAGRLMLKRIQHLLLEKTDFAFETTLASRSFIPMLHNAKTLGYSVNIVYFWLSSPELAMLRVQERVKLGGHFIPNDVIKRRYESGRKNFNTLYRPIADTWIVYDNSNEAPVIVAEFIDDEKIVVYSKEIWNKIERA